jgi:acyl-coenzyme A synthetase/AMP-(fatty) acid ligase
MTALPFLPASRLLAAGRPAGLTVCFEQGRAVTWRDFERRAAGFARAIEKHGARRWLIECPKPLDFAAALFAVLHAGGRAVVAPGLQPGMKELLRPAYDAALGEIPPAPEGDTLLGAWHPIDSQRAWVDLFTSGSSGEPKRVEKSLAQLETETAALEACWGDSLGAAAFVSTVPHHHIYGILFRLLWPLCSARPFDGALCADPRQLVETVARLGDAVLVSSPAHLGRLPELIDLEALEPVRRIFSSGGPLAATAAAEFKRRRGAAPIEVYGSTESGGIAWREQDGSDDSACWRAFAGIALRLDPQGALCVRSPYLSDDAELTMGDAAELLPDGRFRLKGRLDRVVKIEGKRVSLPELEHALRQHPWVLDAAVVPLAGAKESLGAVVVLKEASRLEAGRESLVGALRAFLLERFERVLVPRQWRFPARLPADERGKLTAAGLSAIFGRNDAPAA